MYFKYLAFSKNGEKKKGNIYSTSLEDAVLSIKNQGLDIVFIKRSFFVFTKKLNDFDLFLMFDFLSKFLSNELTLDKSLDMIGSCGIKASEMCLNIKTQITKGFSFSGALYKNKHMFENNNLSIFSIIDEVGSLGSFCKFLSDYYKKVDLKKKKIKKSLKYPIMLSIFFLFSFSIVVNFLVPNIINLLHQMNSTVPLILNVLNHISIYFTQYMMGLVSIIMFIIVMRKRMDNIWNIMSIVRKYRFARDFAFFFHINHMLLNNEIRLINGFKVAKNCMSSQNNIYIIDKVCENIESGCSVNEAFNISKVDKSLCKLMGMYEKSANLRSGFQVISEMYESEMFKILDSVSEYSQPFILAVIASLIGVIVYSMMIPLYSSFV
ncbi:type II secretion system F family protein [Candidatus Cytomitobacter primus]|uniref:Type II secretion system protein GspF domain-containing protein n=1 Tax=Candidatus Cytomitobacter primus TaxID=2066024 RepID=A0A5C0UF98_9PROT|nr:type II secretion system F family protein [Candidatus Cytomitobacter primus]QEK38313.1 hypothetical protein FZC34_00010 [Candidatus Cytomitobacter primus]